MTAHDGTHHAALDATHALALAAHDATRGPATGGLETAVRGLRRAAEAAAGAAFQASSAATAHERALSLMRCRSALRDAAERAGELAVGGALDLGAALDLLDLHAWATVEIERLLAPMAPMPLAPMPPIAPTADA